MPTTKTSVMGAINALDHMLQTFHHTAQHRMTDLCKIVTKNKSDKFGSRHNVQLSTTTYSCESPQVRQNTP